MRLAQRVQGVSKLVLIFLLLIFFLLGATLSYMWTMGFYAPNEFNNPKESSITIEDVKFFAEDASFFNVTVLNPSYSPSNTTIEQVKVETADGKLYDTLTQSLPITLAKGASQTLKSFWNWGNNYTGQTLLVHVYVSEGIGSNKQATTPAMNFNVTNVDFDPSVSVNHFNITVQNAGSSASVNITKILVNGEEVTVPTLTVPYVLANASDIPPVTFMIKRNWADLQGENVAIAVQTLQGYTAYKTWRASAKVSLVIVPPVVFNATDTSHFNMSVMNEPSSPPETHVDLSEVELDVFVNGALDKVVLLNSTEWVADPSSRIEPSIIPTRLVCHWDWSGYVGRGATMTVTVRTVQGFQTPPLSEVEIP